MRNHQLIIAERISLHTFAYVLHLRLALYVCVVTWSIRIFDDTYFLTTPDTGSYLDRQQTGIRTQCFSDSPNRRFFHI